MSFVLPSKYGEDLPLPKDSSVTIKEVPGRIVAVVAFSGFTQPLLHRLKNVTYFSASNYILSTQDQWSSFILEQDLLLMKKLNAANYHWGTYWKMTQNFVSKRAPRLKWHRYYIYSSFNPSFYWVFQRFLLEFLPLTMQYNPPFTLPFNRRNEIALEVERKQV